MSKHYAFDFELDLGDLGFHDAEIGAWVSQIGRGKCEVHIGQVTFKEEGLTISDDILLTKLNDSHNAAFEAIKQKAVEFFLSDDERHVS